MQNHTSYRPQILSSIYFLLEESEDGRLHCDKHNQKFKIKTKEREKENTHT